MAVRRESSIASMSTATATSTTATNTTTAATAGTTTTTTANTIASPDTNNERSAVVLALFGPSVGPCVGDFSTTYNRVNGRLYASTKAILFYSNLFGFERRLCLQLADVELIDPYRSTSIKILMVDCEEYVFRKFANRDSVLNLLQLLLWRHDNPSEAEAAPPEEAAVAAAVTAVAGVGREESGRGPRERTKSILNRRLSLDETEGSDDDMEGSLRPHLNSEVIPGPPDMIPPPTIISPKDRSRPRARSVPPPKRSKKSRTLKLIHSPSLKRSKTTIADQKKDADLSLHSVESQDVSESAPISKESDIQNAWQQAKIPYEEILLDKMKLSCTLDRFEQLFIADNAAFSIIKYQKEQIGDKIIKVTDWKQKNPDEIPIVAERVINFIHPLKNAVGPSEAKTTRTQTSRRFGDWGMTIQNVTVIEGVPAADCFRVEDRWIIEKESDTTLTLLVSFRIIFIKRTLFKPVIQKNIRQETGNWFRGFAKYVRAAVSGDDDVDESTKNTIVEEPEVEEPAALVERAVLPAETRQSPFDNNYYLIGVLVLLCFLAIQVTLLQRSLWSMQSQMIQLQEQNSQLLATLIDLASKGMEPISGDNEFCSGDDC